MGRFISIDLRERILRMILSGSSCRAAARHFGVGESTAIRLRRRYLEQGSICAKAAGWPIGTKQTQSFSWLYSRAVLVSLSSPKCSSFLFLPQFLVSKTACLMILMDLVLESNQDGGESFHLHLDGSQHAPLPAPLQETKTLSL